jgi:hypothetical protein
MSNKFASGKNAIAECDICGFRYKLKQLRALTIKTKVTNILACPECWNVDHPQLQLGMYPVEDPQPFVTHVRIVPGITRMNLAAGTPSGVGLRLAVPEGSILI